MQGLFANRRTKHAAWFLITAMPLLLAAYMVFQHYRPPLKFGDERTWVDIVIMNSDVALALFFLIVSFVPFFLIFGRKPQARDMVPIAVVMAALGVVGRTVFAIVPLPNFKPVSAIVIMTGVVFGPESGFLTGALTGFISNFIFGQGPWTHGRCSPGA
ncbi:MAG: ECF transporter S component [Lachnospiraceae bacterium]